MIGEQYLDQLLRSVPLVCENWPAIEHVPIIVVHQDASSDALAAITRSIPPSRRFACHVHFVHWDLGSDRYPWPVWLRDSSGTRELWARGSAAHEALIHDGWCACNGNRLGCGKFPGHGRDGAQCERPTFASYRIGYCHMGFFRVLPLQFPSPRPSAPPGCAPPCWAHTMAYGARATACRTRTLAYVAHTQVHNTLRTQARDMFSLDVLAGVYWLVNFDSNMELRRRPPYDPVSRLAAEGKVPYAAPHCATCAPSHLRTPFEARCPAQTSA